MTRHFAVPARHLPPPPGGVLDVGGAAGAYGGEREPALLGASPHLLAVGRR